MKTTTSLDLIILAGGRGKRISKFTKKIPKPLIKINNIHFIQYLINFYSKYDFKKIFILTGYKAKTFNKFHKKNFNLIPTECVRERNKLGTGGAILQLRKKIKGSFLLINGDSFVNYDATGFIKKKLPKKNLSKILLVKNNNYKSNNKLAKLKINKDKSVINNGKLMNAGIYFFKKKIFKYLKPGKKSLETEVLPDLIKKNLVQGIYSNKKFLDIGTYANLNKAKNFLKQNTNSYSVFLDRDGVINFDKKYIHKIKDFKFRKNVIRTLKFLNNNKINIFIITNQAGIAKGLYSEKNFFKLSRQIKILLDRKNIYINDLEFCPFHPKAIIKKYKKKSNYRKPGNLMIEKIKKRWGVVPNKSYMIGDTISDYKAAKKSGIYYEYVEKDILKQVIRINKKLNFSNYS
jgi:D-glycero-D-manno-heptose 1,7-bisphosphate phosphatase